MAPILIDHRDIKIIGFIAVLIMLLTFAGGFLLGHQQATVFYTMVSESGSLSLQKENASVDRHIEQRAAEIVETGIKNDVAQSDVDRAELATQAAASVDEKPATGIESINAENLSEYETQIEKSGSAIDETSGTGTSKKDNNQTALTKPAALLTADEAPFLGQPKIKFSIQVGIYGRLINAQNVKRKLQSQQLAAYVSDSANKKNKFRYNVRFGYFVDKKSALTALDEYKNIQKGDGYLVNYSAKNIIKPADADNAEHSDNESSSITGQGNVIQDKVSPLDNIKAPNVLTKSQD